MFTYICKINAVYKASTKIKIIKNSGVQSKHDEIICLQTNLIKKKVNLKVFNQKNCFYDD